MRTLIPRFTRCSALSVSVIQGAEPRAAVPKKARRSDGRTDGPKGDRAPDQKSAPPNPKPAKKSKKKKAERSSLAADFFSGKVRDAEPPKKKPRTRKKK